MLFKCVCLFNVYFKFYNFCNTKIRIAVKQEGTRVDNHIGKSYIQGTGTYQSHGRMKILMIGGLEVWVDHYLRRYRKCNNLNFCMLLLRYCYVVLKDFNTQVVLLQRSGFTWILCFSVCLILLKRIFLSLLLCFYIYFMI